MRTFPVTGTIERRHDFSLLFCSFSLTLMAVAALAKPSYKPVPQIQPPCVDCSIPPECPEPSCAVELTAQCTEECVVIACNDPNHTESICPIDTTQTHCNFLCEQTANCTDCTDFAHLVS